MKQMRCVFTFLWAILTTFCLFSSPTFAEKRVALVIGNFAYRQVTQLRTPKNDVVLMASTLKASGFEVKTVFNANLSDIRKALIEFKTNLRNSNKNTVGLFYYAGHYIRSGQRNYLLPLDARIQTDADVEFETIKFSQIPTMMKEANNILNITIVDICGDYPFNISECGFMAINRRTKPTAIFYTNIDLEALGGQRRHSPYTLSIEREMKVPGQAVEHVIMKARASLENINNSQRIQRRKFLGSTNFYFTKRKVFNEISSVLNTIKKSPNSEIILPLNHTDNSELEYWRSVKNSKSRKILQSYLTRYPNGRFAPLASVFIRNLEAN